MMIFGFGDDLELDERRTELRRKGEILPIAYALFRILLYLIQHRDRVVSRTELFDTFSINSDEALTKSIERLRECIEDDGTTQGIIETRRGQGYILVAEVVELPDDDGITMHHETVAPKLGNVPPVPTLVIGREEALHELKERLGMTSGDHRMQVLTAVRGWPGVGKTTLAAALAHDREIAAIFSDGVLWASLGETPDLLSQLASWGRALGSDDLLRAKTAEEAAAQLTALLRNRHMLLIVDDVWKKEHALLFRGGPACALLITTRQTDVAEALAPTARDVFVLGVLRDNDALELLMELAPQVVEQYRSECEELVRELEGLPLALQVAGRMLNVEFTRSWSVPDLLSELRADTARILNEEAPVDLARETTPTVTALLQKSTARLNPETRESFAYLAAFSPKPATFNLAAMSAVWQAPELDARRTADELIDRGLLEPIGNGRYWMHALLVAHAQSLCTE